MTRILDKTLLSEDEGWDVAGKLGREIEKALKSIGFDSYNAQYVIRVTVDKVDENDTAEVDDE